MFTSFEKSTPKEILPGFTARFIHTKSQTFSWVEIKKGCVLPEHFHIQEQFSRIVKGTFELTVDGKMNVCNAGDVALIDSNIPHSGKAITDCIIMDVFTPVREDYK